MANHVCKFIYMMPLMIPLALATIGHTVKSAELSGSRNCSASIVAEGDPGYLIFHLGQHIQMDAPKFYANLRRAAEPAIDILHCDRANQVSTIDCKVTDASFITDPTLTNHSLLVRIPKMTTKHADVYTLYVYVNGKAETPITCNFTMKAEEDSQQHGDGKASNRWIAASVVTLLLIICGVIAAYVLRKKCRGLCQNRTEGDHVGDATGFFRCFNAGGDNDSHEEIRCLNAEGDNDSHEEKRWYFGKMAEEKEKQLLQYNRNKPGSFLVRQSNANANNYTLAVYFEGLMKHLTISLTENGFKCRSTSVTFNTLCEVVDYYKNNDIKDGNVVCGRLSEPFLEQPEEEWYFGECSRDEEKMVLLSEKNGPGSFFVRDGNTRPDEYIIAVNVNGDVIRFPVEPNENGFTLCDADTDRKFRTLSELVNHYTQHDIKTNDGTVHCKLLNPCTRELESSGKTSRARSHETKRWYFEEMTEENEHKVLQYKRNRPGSFLVRQSKANPDNFILSVCTTDMTIKHLTFCPEQDRLKCRTTGDDFNTLCDVVNYYRKNDINVDGDVWGKLVKPFDNKPEEKWYAGECDRDNEKRLLLSEGNEPGSFLIREGISFPKEYILAVNIAGNVVRFPITPTDDGYKLDDSNTTPFRTLAELVNYYLNNDIIVGNNINRGKLLKPYTGKI